MTWKSKLTKSCEKDDQIKSIVIFHYDAEASDEHTLRVGDVLTNVKKIEEGCCQGMLKGKSDMFPDNFVKTTSQLLPKQWLKNLRKLQNDW